MNTNAKNLTIAVQLLAVILSGMLFRVSDVWAKEKIAAMDKQIQGTWRLVSLYVDKDGEKINAFGINPRGSMILTPNGRFSVIFITQLFPSSRQTTGEMDPPRKIKRLFKVHSPTLGVMK